MARRKKIEPIVTLGNTDKLTVQKSKPLFSLWQSDLTLAEFKILDTYLSRIDSHKPDKRTVIFKKGELEQILNVKQLKTKDLDDRLKNLMITVKIVDERKKRGFTRIALFEKALAEQDDDGLWQVEMTCTQSAMQYIFNIENLQYYRYKLRSIASLTSRYTYIMFIYLEHNRFRKSWEVELAELKKILACENEEYAQEFKYFNRDVLKRVQKEMHEKTECRYSYEPIKVGRVVKAIRFTVETLKDNIDVTDVDTEQMTVFDVADVVPAEQDSAGDHSVLALEDTNTVWYMPLKKLQVNLTQEQYDEVFSVLVTIADYKLPEMQYGGIDIRRYHYLDILVTRINSRAKKEYIRNKYAYLLGIMQKDAQND